MSEAAPSPAGRGNGEHGGDERGCDERSGDEHGDLRLPDVWGAVASPTTAAPGPARPS